VISLRPRGLHLRQARILEGEKVCASLFDVALIAFQVDPAKLKRALTFYIPKSESAEEAMWWRALFQAIARWKGWPANYIKCMALVESHPLAYQMEEFAGHLREHILALDLGRWDYMASLIHFNLHDPNWVFRPQHHPARCWVLSELAQSLARHLPQAWPVGHRRHDRFIPQPGRCRTQRARAGRSRKGQEKRSHVPDGRRMDGSPRSERNRREAVPCSQSTERAAGPPGPASGPSPRSRGCRPADSCGTRAAIRTVIRYRNGVLNGRGASLLDGYMEDLATDRIYRLMIAQRVRHRDVVTILDDNGHAIAHTPELITRLFNEELKHIVGELASRHARRRDRAIHPGADF